MKRNRQTSKIKESAAQPRDASSSRISPSNRGATGSRGRGGYRQNAQRRNDETIAPLPGEEQSTTHQHSAVAKLLMHDLHWGYMQAPKVVGIARACVADGLNHPDIVNLSKLADGENLSHAWRNLCNRMLPSKFTACIGRRFVQMDVRGKVQRCMLAVLLPHALFSVMYHSFRDEFVKRICGGSFDNISCFWKDNANHPALVGHPMKHHPYAKRYGPYSKKAIPIAVHGDGVPTIAVGKAWQKTVEGISWSSCLASGRGTTILLNFIIVFIFKASMANMTNDEIWTYICWSLLALYNGCWPTHDVDGNLLNDPLAGQPLADGFYCVLWLIRADLEFLFLTMKLANYNCAVNPCNLCLANDNVRNFRDARRGLAQWMKSVWTNETFKRAHPDRHPLLNLPGVGILAYAPDILHTKHIGTDGYFLGSVLELLCFYMLANSPQENFDTIWQDIRAAYSRSTARSKFTNMTINMFHKEGGMPFLKGAGAILKCLVPILRSVFAKYMNKDDQQHRFVYAALGESINIDAVLDAHRGKYKLSNDGSNKLLDSCYNFLAYITALGAYYHPKAVRLFNYTIKFHYLLHLGLVGLYTQPLMGACYQGEDLMRVCKRLVQVSAHGSPPHKAAMTAIEKYERALHYTFTYDFAWWK